MNKKLLIAVVTLFLASTTYGVIGDFELSDDGWYDHPRQPRQQVGPPLFTLMTP